MNVGTKESLISSASFYSDFKVYYQSKYRQLILKETKNVTSKRQKNIFTRISALGL